jgi:hypothetical protein
MTPEELEARTALFDTYADARKAADTLLPRRKHNRPYPVRYGKASARAGRDQWIVMVGNIILLNNGFLFDHQRQVMWR